ncbi:hypothetical protein MY7_3599 [Bacillus sp. 5B6]|nr:hypothetical protein MY7_3599 [Bacillus sp. 5B6]
MNLLEDMLSSHFLSQNGDLAGFFTEKSILFATRIKKRYDIKGTNILGADIKSLQIRQ